MAQLKSWQLRLFYLLIFLLPANLAKHFILPSSYVAGILVDYLIPTLYLTDILILLILILWLIEIITSPKQLRLPHTKTFKPHPFIIFLLCLIPSTLFAASPLPAFYKLAKLVLFSLLALWLKHHPPSVSRITRLLTYSVLFQTLLALAQWFYQGSVFDYWFLGEQPYRQSTPGIDKLTWFDGSVKLPPLGTFTHPNVLAGWLSLSFPLVSKAKTKLKLPALILSLIILFLSFSLSAWLAFLLISLPLTLYPKMKSRLRPLKFGLIYLGIFLIIFSFAAKLTFLAPQSSFTRRSQLAQIAVKAFESQPLTGIGLNNFTIVMENYGYVTATTRFLQPVHNIFLLLLAETGLIGFSGFLFLIIKTCLKPNLALSTPLLALLFLGLFDHYPLTLQQPLLFFFITIGLIYTHPYLDKLSDSH